MSSFGAGADLYEVSARFLDGGLEGRTGNSIGGTRGVFISGPRAMALVCLSLSVKMPRAFVTAHGLQDVTLESLKAELRSGQP